MVKYKLKPASAAILSSALVLSSLTGLAITADAATKVKNVTSSAKIKKGKLVKKADGKIIKGYASYKGVIFKNGKKFKGLLNKRYYNNGKKATGIYKSKYYKNGSLGTGTYKNNYYKKGSLFTGKLKGVYYQKGKVFTGVTSKGNYYKKGKLGTGSYKGIYYSVGKKLTGLTSKGVYYKNGKLGNGVYKDVLYKSGKPFNGTLKDEVYVNGKVDANKTANLVFSTAKDAFTSNEDAFKTSKKQVEDLTSLAKKAGVTPAKAASLQVKSAKEIQDFIAKYSSTDFKTLSATELDAFKAELSKFTAEATTNLEAVSKLVNDSTMSLLSAISAMKSFATEEQKAEFTKLTTQANIVIHALKAVGVDTSKLEDALKQTDIKVPEIETPGTDGGTETPGTGTETPGTGGGNNGGGGSTGGGNGGGTVTEKPEEVAKKAAEAAVKALETDPTQEKIVAAQAAVDALTALDKDYNVEDFKTAIAAAQKLVEDAKAEKENIEKATNAVNALFNDPTTEPLVIKDSIVKADIEAASTLVETLKDSEVKTELKGKITSASTQLEEALKTIKPGLNDGTKTIEGTNLSENTIFTYRMAGIELNGEDVQYVSGTKNEAKKLTPSQVNDALVKILNAKGDTTIKKDDLTFQLEKKEKHGFTILQPKFDLTEAQYKLLDHNQNNAYFITVTAPSTGVSQYKILVQFTDSKAVSTFVEKTDSDENYTILLVAKGIQDLFTDDSKTTLKEGVSQETINKLTGITNTIVKNTAKANEFKESLKRAADLLQVTALQTELDAVKDTTTNDQFKNLSEKVEKLDSIAKNKLKLDSFNSYKALADAKTFTTGTFTLKSDITITEAVHLKGSVILDGGKHTVTVASTPIKNDLSGIGLSGTATLQNIIVQGQGNTTWADNLLEIIGGESTRATIENVTIKDGYQAGLLVQTKTNLTVKGLLTLDNNLWGGGEIEKDAKLTFVENSTFNYKAVGETPPFWIDAEVTDAQNIKGADEFLNGPEIIDKDGKKQTFYTLKVKQ